MTLEDKKRKRIAKILQGLSRQEINAILKEQSALLGDKEKARRERELKRLAAREEKLKASLQEVRKRISDLEQGKSLVRRRRGEGNVTGRSFPDLVLEVVREKGEPSRPRDVRIAFLDKGWYQGSDRSLNSSVATALRELVKEGKLRKTGDRRYSV
jgi:hypothetical protein